MNTLYIQGLHINHDTVDASSYLNKIPAITNTQTVSFEKNITFFVGENGTGKSTLLEAIALAYGFNAEGGTLNYRFSTFDEENELEKLVSLHKSYKRPEHHNYFFRAESFFNVATQMEKYRDGESKNVYYQRYGGKNLHEQSHGESFLSYFQAFKEDGLYLMDEPEAALSPQRQLTLLIQMHEMAQKGAQFIVATHSPILLAMPHAQIYAFEQTIRSIAYEDVEAVQIIELFINHKEYILKKLLADES